MRAVVEGVGDAVLRADLNRKLGFYWPGVGICIKCCLSVDLKLEVYRSVLASLQAR